MVNPMSDPVTSIARSPERMPSVEEIFGERTTPRPALSYTPPDDDTPSTREGRVIRHLAADLVERDAQLREALGERDNFRECYLTTQQLLGEALRTVRRQRDTIHRQNEFIRAHPGGAKDQAA